MEIINKDEEQIIKTSMEYSWDKFWDAIEEAAKSKDKNDVDVAVGLILENQFDNLTDINQDGLVNVIDIVMIVDIILNQN